MMVKVSKRTVALAYRCGLIFGLPLLYLIIVLVRG